RNAEGSGAPMHVRTHNRDLRVHGAGGALGHDLERLRERRGGRQGQPCTREGVQLLLTLCERHQPDPGKVWSKGHRTGTRLPAWPSPHGASRIPKTPPWTPKQSTGPTTTTARAGTRNCGASAKPPARARGSV